MAAAYATLRTSDIPDATPQLNVAQRVGGSVGTALLSVTLSQRMADVLPAGGASAGAAHGPVPPHLAAQLAHAFGQTYWLAVAITAVALIPALLLAGIERRNRITLAREHAGIAEFAR